MKQEHKNKFSDEELLELFKEHQQLSKIAAILKVPHITVFRRAQKLNLKFPKGKFSKLTPLSEILEGLHPHFQTFKLKLRMLNEGLIENKCEICGIIEWNGKPINMQLDHIDGDSSNHIRSNLRMICPNCHSQTHTFCGKNK